MSPAAQGHVGYHGRHHDILHTSIFLFVSPLYRYTHTHNPSFRWAEQKAGIPFIGCRYRRRLHLIFKTRGGVVTDRRGRIFGGAHATCILGGAVYAHCMYGNRGEW